MESPLYSTLSIHEKESLVSKMAENYPFLLQEEDEEIQLGYESSWQGIIKTHIR
jgi:hypothetical protein